MRRPRSLTPVVLLGGLALVATAAGCRRDGCVGGDDGQCVPPAACPALVYAACATPKLRVEQIGPADPERVSGPKALAAEGDYLLENDLVRVVIDAPDHPHFIGPSGGAIVDLAPLRRGPDDQTNPGDQTNAIYHAAGVLPRDAVHYESAAIVDPRLDAGGAGRLRRGDLPRPPGERSAGHRRHPVRAAPLRARRPCPQRSVQRHIRSEDALPRRRILLGRQRPGALRSRAGARVPRAEPRSGAPRSGLAAMAVSRGPLPGGAGHGVCGDRLRPIADGGVQQLFADRCRRAARRDPAGRRISLRAIHPRRGGARPGSGGGRGAACPDGRPRRSARGHRPGPRRRQRCAGQSPLGERRLAALLRAGRRPERRRSGPHHPLERGGPGQ